MKQQVDRAYFPTLWQDALQAMGAYAVIALLPLALIYRFFAI